MVAEGIVALIWAAAAVTYCHGYAGLQQAMSSGTPAVLVNNLSRDWLGTVGGILAILGVVAAPITTGDTALRSARLILADITGIKQQSIVKRLLVSLPVFALCFAVMLVPYEVLWRYFAWSNQVLSVFTLWTITVWLARNRKAYLITLIPALFMTMVTTTYIFYAPEGLTIAAKAICGHPIPYSVAIAVAGCVTATLLLLFGRTIKSIDNQPVLK